MDASIGFPSLAGTSQYIQVTDRTLDKVDIPLFSQGSTSTRARKET
jgi:hypothetical protein